MKSLGIFIAVCLFAISCKQSNTSDEQTLKDALAIQDEAIHISIDLDTILDQRFRQGNKEQNIDQLKSWKQQIVNWRDQMVSIPGMEHDHDHGDHSGHNHSGHDHDHNHGQSSTNATHLTAAEMKEVQLSWKKSIEALRDSIGMK